MPILKALSNIKHDGVEHAADYTLEVGESEANALIEAGVAIQASDRDIKVASALRQADADEAATLGPINNAPTADTAAKLDRSDTSLGHPQSPNQSVNGDAGDGDEQEVKQPSLEWSRKNLEAHADSLGIEGVAQMPNKQAVFDAIVAKTAGDAGDGDEQSE